MDGGPAVWRAKPGDLMRGSSTTTGTSTALPNEYWGRIWDAGVVTHPGERDLNRGDEALPKWRQWRPSGVRRDGGVVNAGQQRGFLQDQAFTLVARRRTGNHAPLSVKKSTEKRGYQVNPGTDIFFFLRCGHTCHFYPFTLGTPTTGGHRLSW